MKVAITAYHAVAFWKWDLPGKEDDSCGICPHPYDGTCFHCTFPGDDCPLMIGECGHAFHMHCLDGWFKEESSKGTCPMCRQVFKTKAAAPLAGQNADEAPLAVDDQAMDVAAP